ncbi:MAG: hypothetical protein WAO22_07610, partial [bacterium]
MISEVIVQHIARLHLGSVLQTLGRGSLHPKDDPLWSPGSLWHRLATMRAGTELCPYYFSFTFTPSATSFGGFMITISP